MKKLRIGGLLFAGITLASACAGKKLNHLGELGGNAQDVDGGAPAAGGAANSAAGTGAGGNASGDDGIDEPVATGGEGGEAPLSCSDRAQDSRETDVDCGGGRCAPCPPGLRCVSGNDCQSGSCGGPSDDGLCEPLHCGNHAVDSDETDVDCGGTGCHRCSSGKSCQSDASCLSGACQAGVCVEPCQRQSDCGRDGSCHAGLCEYCAYSDECSHFAGCSDELECACRRGIFVCVEQSCGNGLQEGAETDVDCGGGDCKVCENGQRCVEAADCSSGFCAGRDNGFYQYCFPAHCNDRVTDEDETGRDCGGPSCAECGQGGDCETEDDCESGLLCEAHVCIRRCNEQTAHVCTTGQCVAERCVECEVAGDCLNTCATDEEMRCHNLMCECAPK